MVDVYVGLRHLTDAFRCDLLNHLPSSEAAKRLVNPLEPLPRNSARSQAAARVFMPQQLAARPGAPSSLSCCRLVGAAKGHRQTCRQLGWLLKVRPLLPARNMGV